MFGTVNLGAVKSTATFVTGMRSLTAENTTMTTMSIGKNDTPTGSGTTSSLAVTQKSATLFAEETLDLSKQAGAEAFEASLEDQALLEASKKEIHDVV